MTEDEKVDNRRSEEGDEGTIYIQPIETESMGLESDLPEDDQAVGEDLPDGFKKLIKTTVKAVACGLSPKTKEEDKTSYIQHVDMYEPAASNKHISQPIGTPTMVEEVVHDLNLHMRGYMVLIVNRTFDKKSLRYGAENDLENMQNIAEKLGYKIHNTEYCENLNQSETMDVLQNARKADHSQCDSFAVMISTHGCEEPNSKAKGKMDHALICADDKMIFTSTITEMFNDENCPTLKGKTKLFFIQACRGENLDEGVNLLCQESLMPPHHASTPTRQHSVDKRDAKGAKETNKTSVEEKKDVISISKRSPDPIVETTSLKCENDQLVFYATTPGRYAWRNEREGSWMIYYLYTIVKANYEKRQLNLPSLLTMVSASTSLRESNIPGDTKLDKKKAVCVIEHKLTKHVVFNP